MKNYKLNAKALGSLCENEIPNYKLTDCKSQILHIGVGNFHRSHQANYLHKLLQQNDNNWRICGAGIMPQDLLMKNRLAEQDYLYTLISQESELEDIKIIGSIRDFIHIPTEYDKYLKKFCESELKIVSLTITEKGYCNDTNWDLDIKNELIQHDLTNNDEIPLTGIGVLAKGLKARMNSKVSPITIMSCDNIPENGNVLKKLLLQFINLSKDYELIDYINKNIKFPCSMVDRITPITTDEKIKYLYEKYGIEDSIPVFSEKYIQWVIEDDFNVDRPRWEDVGAQIVKDVKPYELMKTRLLNGGHTALAFPSLLKGFIFVDDAMKDKQIKKFVKSYMNEVKVTLKDIEDVDYDEYIEKLIIRFANPATKDRILRLAEDTSAKFLNFVINPLMLLLESNKKVPMITTVLASWIIYLNKSISNADYIVKDPLKDKIQKAASLSIENVTNFLSLSEIFPNKILEKKEFVEDLQKTINSILEDGIISVI